MSLLLLIDQGQTLAATIDFNTRLRALLIEDIQD